MVMLGNLSVTDIERRLGVEFDEATRNRLNETHQPLANEIIGQQWHCFDIPFFMHCGSEPFAYELANLMKPLAADFKCRLGFSISEMATEQAAMKEAYNEDES